MLIPSNSQLLFNPHRSSNHFGSEKKNIKKVKIVPIKESLSLLTSNKRIGLAKPQPNIYKKGINIIVDNNFGLNKNNHMYTFNTHLKKIFILIDLHL